MSIHETFSAPSSVLSSTTAPDSKRQRLDAASDDMQAPAWALSMQAQMAATMQAQLNTYSLVTRMQIEASRVATLAATRAQVEASRAATQAQIEQVAALVTERLDALERTVDAGHVAMGAGARVILAKRRALSPAEEVLAIPYFSKRSIMSFLRQGEVLELRAASRTCRDAVTEHAWHDTCKTSDTSKSLIRGSLALWRRCFPHATAANLRGRYQVDDADLVHLRGIRWLDIRACMQITDAGFAHLRGIHTLWMSGCTAITDAGLAHLRGINTLHMIGCTSITNAGLAHLRGIRALWLDGCTEITDAGLAHLRGSIRELHMANLSLVTNAGLAHLSGVSSLGLGGCTGITDAGLLHLRGVRWLWVASCPQLTDAGLAQLEGVVIKAR